MVGVSICKPGVPPHKDRLQIDTVIECVSFPNLTDASIGNAAAGIARVGDGVGIVTGAELPAGAVVQPAANIRVTAIARSMVILMISP